MHSSRVSGMFSFRSTLLVLILGSAALVGWLGYPSRHSVDSAAGARSVDGPMIHPSHAHTHGRHSVPGRQRTNPDPTPDDWGDECSSLVDLEDLGPDWVVLTTLSGVTTCGLIESPSPEWSEPARYTPLLQFTHRFRC
jgi:hypothetical protein